VVVVLLISNFSIAKMIFDNLGDFPASLISADLIRDMCKQMTVTQCLESCIGASKISRDAYGPYCEIASYGFYGSSALTGCKSVLSQSECVFLCTSGIKKYDIWSYLNHTIGNRSALMMLYFIYLLIAALEPNLMCSDVRGASSRSEANHAVLRVYRAKLVLLYILFLPDFIFDMITNGLGDFLPVLPMRLLIPIMLVALARSSLRDKLKVKDE